MTNENKTPDFKSLMSQLDGFLTEYLTKKAPQLPTNAREIIVKYSPYISILVLVITLPAVLAIFGLAALVTPFAYLGGFNAGFSLSIASIVLLVSVVVEALAIPGLFGRKKSAWNLMYYYSLITLLYNICDFHLINGLISAIISLYILFQIRSYYKN